MSERGAADPIGAFLWRIIGEQPNCCAPGRNAACEAVLGGSSAETAPTRRIRSGCCARAASGLHRDLDGIVNVILAGTGASALAAKGATTTIPIVFVMGSDPVKIGAVSSLSRPGGNITGAFMLSTALEAKRL